MDLQLIELLDFCREPILALEGTTVFHLNTAARALFPNLVPGESAGGIMPEYLLFDESENSMSSAVIGGREFSVCSMRLAQLRLLSFRTEQTADRSLISDGLMNTMNSSLFNIELSIRQLEKNCDPDSQVISRYLTLMRHNSHQLARQLSNLRITAQLQEKSVLLRPQHCNLAALCRDLTAAVNSLAAGTLSALEFTCPLPSLDVCLDPELIKRLILNLISNSFSHCPPDSTVRLGLEKRGDRAFLSVDDDGCGIPDDVLRNVFSRYENRMLPGSLNTSNGGGLGLGVARGIAELHGGALIIESKPQRGTSVRVMLPLHQPGSDIFADSHEAPDCIPLSLLLTELSDVLAFERFGFDPDE